MTLDEAVELVQGWPKDRSVPRKLKEGVASAKGLDKALMSQMVEALVAASTSQADFDLVEKYFS